MLSIFVSSYKAYWRQIPYQKKHNLFYLSVCVFTFLVLTWLLTFYIYFFWWFYLVSCYFKCHFHFYFYTYILFNNFWLFFLASIFLSFHCTSYSLSYRPSPLLSCALSFRIRAEFFILDFRFYAILFFCALFTSLLNGRLLFFMAMFLNKKSRILIICYQVQSEVSNKIMLALKCLKKSTKCKLNLPE